MVEFRADMERVTYTLLRVCTPAKREISNEHNNLGPLEDTLLLS